MGATVTTGRRASAFRARDGRIIYVILEQTYDRNCHPHTPHWCCIGIGEIGDVIRRIFQYASSCEGGMLQNRSGRITPEGYLRSWMDELAAPVELMDRPIVLRVGEHYSHSVETEKLSRTEDILTALGRWDIVQNLRTEKTARLSLFEDIDVVLALYGLASGIFPAWKVIDHSQHLEREHNALLGYNPAPAVLTDAQAGFPRFIRISEDERLIDNQDGSYSSAGWAYSVVQSFVENFHEEELRFPGTYAKRIKAFRAHVSDAPRVPLETLKVVVDTTTPPADKWQRRSIEEFKEKYALTATPTGFEVQLTEENLYLATKLPEGCTRWILVHDLVAA
jgi:hypothetical protein